MKIMKNSFFLDDTYLQSPLLYITSNSKGSEFKFTSDYRKKLRRCNSLPNMNSTIFWDESPLKLLSSWNEVFMKDMKEVYLYINLSCFSY